MYAGPAIRAPTRSPATASGATSYATMRDFGAPARNWRFRPNPSFPVTSNAPFARSRSVAGWRTRSRFESSNSFARYTSAGRGPTKSSPIRVTVTAPLLTPKVAVTIAASVCH